MSTKVMSDGEIDERSPVRRPVLRYHGGKWKLAPWLISLMPPHRVYCEPFGGAANVLLRKPRVSAECYNDLDDAVVNVFRVLQDPEKAERLRRRLSLTPFARSEFDRSYEPAVDDVDAAAKTIFRSFSGHGTDSVTRSCRTGFRAKMHGHGGFPSKEWSTWPSQMSNFIARFAGVLIERRPATEVMRRLDGLEVLFLVDPPYVISTRSSLAGRSQNTHGYRFELSDAEHRELAEVMRNLRGMVMLCGYDCELYRELYGDWVRLDRDALADGARKRVESVWLNPAAAEKRHGLFSEAAL